MLVTDECIKLISTDGKVLGTLCWDVDGITLGLAVWLDLGTLDGSSDGFNDSELEGSLLGD